MTQPSLSALSKQSVHTGKTSTRQDISVGYFVQPGYAQDTADASLVECVEPTFLPGICSPCLAAIQQCADNTGNVYLHICLRRHLGACPHSNRATSESWSCLPNPLVDLCVQWEVVSDGGAAVGELADSIVFVVVNANDRRCLCVLAYLCICSETGDVEEPVIWARTKVDSFCCCV